MAEKKAKKKSKVKEEKPTEKPAKKPAKEEEKPEEVELKLSLPSTNFMVAAILFFAVGFFVSDAIDVNFIGGTPTGNVVNPGVTTTTNPSAVTTTLSSNPLNVIVLNDKRCPECVTGMQSLLTQLETLFPKMNVKELDYGSDEGKDLYKAIGLKYLPALLFDDSVKDSANYNSIQGYMEEKGNYLSLRIGANFDPTAEICDNGIDDTGNGLVDCDDPSCGSKLICNKNAIAECAEPYNITPDTIIFYYSNQCGWCAKMKPGVEKLQNEGYSFYWAEGSDAESTEVIEKCIGEYMTSGGVPQFICVKNGKIKVGAFTDENRNLDEEALKKFADDCIAG